MSYYIKYVQNFIATSVTILELWHTDRRTESRDE